MENCDLERVTNLKPGRIWTFLFIHWGFPVAQTVKNLPTMWKTWVQSPSGEDPLAEDMAIHSSILAWKFSWTEEPGGLQSMWVSESDTTDRLSTKAQASATDSHSLPQPLRPGVQSQTSNKPKQNFSGFYPNMPWTLE